MGDTYKNIRALERGLRILEALGDLGWTKLGELSSYAEIDRATVYRIVDTLEKLGYIVRREEDGAIALHRRLATIADSIHDTNSIAQAIEPLIQSLTRRILWPSDFGGIAGGKLTVLASTNRMSPFSVNRPSIGMQVPLLRSALGRAILSSIDKSHCLARLELIPRNPKTRLSEEYNKRVTDKIQREFQRTGYARSVGQVKGGVSAIALPVRCPDMLGAINIVFSSSAMSVEEAAEKYLGQLHECVQEVERLF